VTLLGKEELEYKLTKRFFDLRFQPNALVRQLLNSVCNRLNLCTITRIGL